MEDILNKYKSYLSTKYALSTQKTYYDNVRLFLDFLEKNTGKENNIIQICNIEKKDLYLYIVSLEKLSRNTKEIKIASIRNFYLYLNSHLGTTLFEDIKFFDKNQKLPKALSLEQVEKLVHYYKDERNQLIILIFLSTGIRLSELESILIENIDFDKKIFFVKVKGGDTKKIFLSKNCCEQIKKFTKDRRKGKLFNIKKRAIQTIVKKAMNDLEIEGSVHTLRHTFATTMYKKTKDILLVSELLNHKTILSTQIYMHVDNDDIRNAVNANPLANF